MMDIKQWWRQEIGYIWISDFKGKVDRNRLWLRREDGKSKEIKNDLAQHENIWPFAWADFRVIYSDKETREEEEEEGKNVRIPARAILSCAWSDAVSEEKAHTWREQMPQWETVLSFVSMVIIVSIQGCISFVGGTHKEKHAQQNSTNKHLEDHEVEFWKSYQYCGKINNIMNSQSLE